VKNTLPLDSPIWDTWLSFLHYPTLSVADEIGLFEKLSKHPLLIPELAKALNISEHACRAITTVLCGLSFLEEVEGKLALTETSRSFLIPGERVYWGGVLAGARQRPDHARLLDALKRSSPTLKYEGKNLTEMWQTGELSEEVATRFTAAMHSHTYAAAIGAASSECFQGITKLLDVGGGSGCFCFALAEKYPKAEFGVFELPVVCRVTEKYADTLGYSKQVKAVPGNFFNDAFPKGYDAMLFSNVFHDWGPAQGVKFAEKAFQSLEKGGKIFLHEMLRLGSSNTPLTIATFSLLMLINHGEGRQYSFKELGEILSQAGFTDIKATPTFGYFSVVSAIKK